ncbi:hypothetical protein BS47DRAFT_1308081 [Hydnum rufescens UP504]|uniref:Helitron helicase-like domain-containing protein n=1 Tax=Hydnum rufescens UP504 TaxID=1448309 RepID=A0A9P6AGF4_9AGAM|nr:hypothetical protein BS47DRAFT_1308081 [Hydnum rufescens UP504]
MAADLQQAADKYETWQNVSNLSVGHLLKHLCGTASHVMGTDQSCSGVHSKVWSTTLVQGPPSLWITINPCDIHDPVAQVFTGADIDLDRFCWLSGPSAPECKHAIVNDLYGAAKFFHFTINAMLKTLLGIDAAHQQIHRWMGILGMVDAYIGTVESQNQGALHLHMIVWLENSPSSANLHLLFKSVEFCNCIHAYIYGC